MILISTQNICSTKKTIMKYIKLIIVLLLPITGNAQDIHDYLNQVNANLALKVYDAESREILSGKDESKRMPNFKIGAGYGVLPVETRLGPQNLKLFGEQRFAPFGSFGTRENLINELAALKGSEAEVLKAQLFYKLENNWYEMAAINEVIAVERKNLKILQSFENIALAKNEAARGRASDVLRAQMNINDAENRIDLLQDELLPLRSDFNALLNRNLTATIDVPGAIVLKPLPAANEARLLQAIQLSNPQLTFLDRKSAVIDSKVAVEELKNKPAFGLGLEYGFIGNRNDANPSNNGKDVFMPRVIFSLPLFNGKANAAAIDRANTERGTIEAQRLNIINQLETELRYALNRRSDALKKLELYKEQIKLAKSTQDMLLNSYSATGSEFEEILRIQDTIYDLEVKQVQAKKEHNMAVSYIESLTGLY